MRERGWMRFRWGAIALATLAVGEACKAPATEDASAPRAAPEHVGAERASSGPASDAAQANYSPTSAATFAEDGEIVFWSAGLAKQLEDPRDAGVLRALSMIDERLVELVDEIGDGGPPPGAIELACDLLRSPSCLRLEILDDQPAAPLPLPFRVQWTVRCGSSQAVQSLVERVEALLALGMPPATVVERHPDLRLVPSPVGSFYYGKTDEGDFVVSMGEPWARWPEAKAFGLADGVEPVLAFGIDITTLLRTGLSLGGSETEMARAMLERMGLLRQEPYMFQFVAGHAADRAVYAMRQRNWVPMARETGSLPSGTLTREELGIIPADATFASFAKAEPNALLTWLELTQQSQAAKDHVRELLGLDLATDLVDPIGNTFGCYLSGSTGGGGLTSAVFVAALDDEVRFGRTLDTLVKRLEDEVELHAPGRVRQRTWEHEGLQCRSIVFPGLPVPLEPSFALTHGRLFAAATPGALAAALEQAGRGDGGLLANPAFRAHALGSLDDLQSLMFLDSPALLEEGYGYAALLGSALANAVRSASDGSREPGLVLPTYPDLREGARPLILLARVQGDDLVTAGEADRSAVAHVTAFLGWMPSLISVLGAVGALSGIDESAEHELEEALDASEVVRARADILSLHGATMQYAIENGGRFPDSLDVLGVPDENGMSFMDAPGPYLDPWGNPYGYEQRGGEDPRIFSLGADGTPGGDGVDADIDNLDEDEDGD